MNFYFVPKKYKSNKKRQEARNGLDNIRNLQKIQKLRYEKSIDQIEGEKDQRSRKKSTIDLPINKN